MTKSLPQRQAERCLADVLAMLAKDDVPAPDETRDNWAKWSRPDGGCVIFRANYRGDFGTLDVRWLEDDGGWNGLFAPKSYEYIGRLGRDIRILIALRDVPIAREVLVQLGRPS